MTPFARNTAIFVVLIASLFGGGFWLAAREMPVMLSQSRTSLQTFLRALERDDFAGASASFSRSLSADLSAAELKQNWEKTRTKIGQLQGFESADATSASGGRVNLWPPFVDYLLRARGKNGSQVWSFRLVPENGEWKIERLSELRNSPAQNS